MNAWTDGRTDGRADAGRTNGRTDGWVGRIFIHGNFIKFPYVFYIENLFYLKAVWHTYIIGLKGILKSQNVH